MADREAEVAGFLAGAGWQGADLRPLAGDASARRYARLKDGGRRAVLMDNPGAAAVEENRAFIAIAAHLRKAGLSAPEVLAADLPAGLMLLEDLGDDLYARLLARDASEEPALYTAAAGVLADLQARPAPPGLPDLTAEDWAEAAMLVFDWYAPGDRTGTRSALTDALARHADGPRVLILRDFHAENLLWLPLRQGLARVGLLDFQMAQMGQPVYDLVSLIQDARRDVGAATAHHTLRRFADLTGREAAALASAVSVTGAQRALRILGVFARLARQDGKRQYLALMPRVWGQLQACLAHPALSDLRRSLTLPTPESFAA